MWLRGFIQRSPIYKVVLSIEHNLHHGISITLTKTTLSHVVLSYLHDGIALISNQHCWRSYISFGSSLEEGALLVWRGPVDKNLSWMAL